MIKIDRITVSARTAKCAHSCRYCMQGGNRVSLLDWDTYTQAVEKYVRWGEEHGLNVSFELSGSYDLSIERYKWFLDMSKRCGKHQEGLLMGGMRMRTEDEIRNWLAERMELGVRKVIFSMSGTEPHHDRMNGRKGDLQYLLGAQRAAFSLGLDIEQRIFITKENLDSMEELCGILDKLGKPMRRSIYPLHFRGNATELETLRIDENDLKVIPESVMKYMLPEQLLTEAQWVEKLSTDQTPYAESVGITLPLDAETINRNCADVIAGAKEAVAAEYEEVPCIGELCRTYGDSSSGKIHEGRMKMIGVWFDRYAGKPGKRRPPSDRLPN